MAIIEVAGLCKSYGKVKAAHEVTFNVEDGEVFGILGPNGAGKTTTLEIIEGLRTADSGSVRVCDIDVLKEKRAVQELIGVQLQSTTLFDELTVMETIHLFQGLFSKKVNLTSLVTKLALTDKQKSPVKELSGGQKQRLALALALVNDPKVLFLDEPTTGLDPQARRSVWELVQEIRSNGKTVVLTTHYMEEAESLCDRVAVMDHGKIIAMDTPRQLIKNLGFDNTIEFSIGDGLDVRELEKLPSVKSVHNKEKEHHLFTQDPQATLLGLMRLAQERSAAISDLRVHTASLEDVFISLTGRRLRE